MLDFVLLSVKFFSFWEDFRPLEHFDLVSSVFLCTTRCFEIVFFLADFQVALIVAGLSRF